MISSISGPMLALFDDAVVISVGGLGMRCEIPASTAQEIAALTKGMGAATPGLELTVFTSLVVREDSLTLFGFLNESERDAFEVLMKVSGIGPRLAVAALSDLGIDELRRAVVQEDLKSLQRISGVGKKTAQRMILEIGDKLGEAPTSLSSVGVGPADSPLRDTVEAALEQLGWPRAVATRVVADLDDADGTVESMLRQALLKLGANRG